MRLIKIFFGILLCFIVFTSCQKNIEFNEEILKPMVVVHGFLCPDTVVSVHVSLSHFFLNDTASFKDINNADVTVIVNGTLNEKMKLTSDGQYQGTYRPVMGDVIKLVIQVPSMNKVSSITSINTVPVIITVDTTKTIQNSSYDISQTDTLALKTEFKTKYNLKFTDNGDEKNYYRLIVQSREHNSVFIYGYKIDQIIDNRYYSNLVDQGDEQNSSSNSLTETITGENTNTNLGNKYNIFSDANFNGKTYSITFNIDYWLYTRYPSNLYNMSGSTPERIEVFISLQSISKDYYYYLKSRSASGGDDFFSEPIQIKNNIVGGIGFLGSYTSSNVVKYDLK